MNLTDTPWSCQCCGAAFISTPPDHGLCAQCLTDLAAAARAQTQAPTCMDCGGPVCPDCGQAMALVIAIPAPPNLVPAVSGSHAGEVNGDGG
jgi:hypothetical protein